VHACVRACVLVLRPHEELDPNAESDSEFIFNNDLEPGSAGAGGREKPRGMRAAALGQTSEGRAGRQAGRGARR